MDDKRITQHFHFSDIGAAVMFALAGLGAGVYLLYRGIEARSPVAYLVLGGLVFMVVAGIGGGAVLFVMRQVVKAEEKRSLVEQGRFRDNAIQDMGIMSAMQKVQNQQNAMLLKQAREAQRSLPAPEGDVIDVAGFQYSESLFDDIEMED